MIKRMNRIYRHQYIIDIQRYSDIYSSTDISTSVHQDTGYRIEDTCIWYFLKFWYQLRTATWCALESKVSISEFNLMCFGVQLDVKNFQKIFPGGAQNWCLFSVILAFLGVFFFYLVSNFVLNRSSSLFFFASICFFKFDK